MNYRHHFHAGNFADVVKHVVLVQLLHALQTKEKGFLYLDTHAGRGKYDLLDATTGDSRARTPEWPDGIGRIWTKPGLTSPSAEYASLVRQFDHDHGNRASTPRFLPGSPWLARLVARPQDRLALCEKHPEEFAGLQEEFVFSPRTSVHLMDGYQALKAMLPPLERRALVLIDPSYEEREEFSRIILAVREAVGRLPGGTFVIWYPVTERARTDDFFREFTAMPMPPTLVAELTVGGEQSGIRMRGSGLVIINPPWKFENRIEPTLGELHQVLAQAPGADYRLQWLVPEK
jgi:23S rRNA (adenine2030-N6)-methyltransferase